jgi:hypothetical protein
MTAEFDIQDCVYCGQPIDGMPLLTKTREHYSLSATYYCGNCESNFTLYFEEDENGSLRKL